MMTRRHFAAIANVFDLNEAPLALVQDFADMLEEQNPRFDRVLFIRASTNVLRGKMAHEQRMLDRATGKV